MLVIDKYELRVNDMIINRLTKKEPVFAEYVPVEMEYAFMVKNGLEGTNEYARKKTVISTKGRMKEYAEETSGKFGSSLVSNFISKKTILGREKL